MVNLKRSTSKALGKGVWWQARRAGRPVKVEMAGHASGSINRQRDTFRSAGEHQEYAFKLLDLCLADLHKAKDNVGANRVRAQEMLLQKVVDQTTLAQATLLKTAHAWRAAANVDSAVRRRVQTCTREGLVEALRSYNDSPPSGEITTPTGQDMDYGSASSVRGGHEVRLRTTEVRGHQIHSPLNGAWYQTSEAVRILYDLKHSNSRIGLSVYNMWTSKSPPWIDISYSKLMLKVRKVDRAVSNTKCTVDTAIKQLIRDRVALDQRAKAGRPYLLSRDNLVDSMIKNNRHTPASAVVKSTVDMCWQHMGCKQFPAKDNAKKDEQVRF
jgi:hypothetical protein